MAAAPSNGGSAARVQKKWSKWVGVRYRHWGRWAAEIRVPRTRSRLWIGTFDDDQQAAHAYDAAMFCFYGERLPKPRKFNFPAAPRPDVPEHLRVRLTVGNIKAIAEKYARTVRVFYVPPPPPAALVLEVPGGGAAAGAGAVVATSDHDGYMMIDDMEMDDDIVTCADCLLSFNPDEYVGVMDELLSQY